MAAMELELIIESIKYYEVDYNFIEFNSFCRSICYYRQASEVYFDVFSIIISFI